MSISRVKDKMQIRHISLTEAKQNLGEFVKRAAYGGERFVLEFRGKPRAVLISYDELERVTTSQVEDFEPITDEADILADLKTLREEIRSRGEHLPSSADALDAIRQERLDDFTNMC